MAGNAVLDLKLLADCREDMEFWGQTRDTHDPDPGFPFCLALKELEKYWNLNTFFKTEKGSRWGNLLKFNK